MIRKLAAVALGASFLALASSGLLMTVVARPSLTIQLHPVHKVFGVVLVVAGSVHLALNARALRAHLRSRAVALAAAVLVLAVVALWALAIANPLPAEHSRRLDDAASQAEAAR